MRIICTTVQRGSACFEESGRIIEFDTIKKEIVNCLSLPACREVIGDRGLARGARGVREWSGKIYVAIYDRILVYDRAWLLLGWLHHPHMADLHEIAVDESGIWAASTGNDVVIQLDHDGQLLFEWWAGEDPIFTRWTNGRLVRWPRAFDYSTFMSKWNDGRHPYKQFHINNVYRDNGRTVAYDCFSSSLFQVYPVFRPVIRNRGWRSSHNVQIRRGHIYVNNSGAETFDVWTVPKLPSFLWPFGSSIIDSVHLGGRPVTGLLSRSGWTRGLILLGKRDVIVGCTPGRLYRVRKGTVTDLWPMSSSVDAGIHGLTMLQR